jgi:hypothetical protein
MRKDEVMKLESVPCNSNCLYFKGSLQNFILEGGGEMSVTTSRPPIRWSESSGTHLDEVVGDEGIEPPTFSV